MAHPSDVDSDLETEIREEMKKYGQLNNVIVHQVNFDIVYHLLVF